MISTYYWIKTLNTIKNHARKRFFFSPIGLWKVDLFWHHLTKIVYYDRFIYSFRSRQFDGSFLRTYRATKYELMTPQTTITHSRACRRDSPGVSRVTRLLRRERLRVGGIGGKGEGISFRVVHGLKINIPYDVLATNPDARRVYCSSLCLNNCTLYVVHYVLSSW